MKTTATIRRLVWIVLGFAILSCGTTDSLKPEEVGKMRLKFDNVVGTSDLTLRTGAYQNAVGESFTITKFNYYVSNIRLSKEDGRDYLVPQDSSYFLVQEEKLSSQTITLSNVPVGKYTGLTFTIGVDSVRSLSDISLRTGALDPANNDGMYWEWNSGYIFMKLEGVSPVAPAAQNNTFIYHIGGFGGGYSGKKTVNNLRTVTLSFMGNVADVQQTTTPSIQIRVDALQVFNGPTKLSIAQRSAVMFDNYSPNVANNYAQMFRYDQIQTNR